MNQHLKPIVSQRGIATFIVALVALPTWHPSAIAQTATENSRPVAARSLSFKPPPPPPERDAPGHRGGGAGRSCAVGNQLPIALVPEYIRPLAQGGKNIQVWGTTTSGHPTFWFDVPYAERAIASLEFVIQDNSSQPNDLYRTVLTPPASPGIVRVQLPATVAPLEAGKLYQWYLKLRLQCGTKSQIAKEQLNGWVQRVNLSPSLTNQLKQATPPQRAALYAQNGIWFDALTTLGELRLANPQNPQLAQDWRGLLASIGLEPLTQHPLVPCCQPSAAQ